MERGKEWWVFLQLTILPQMRPQSKSMDKIPECLLHVLFKMGIAIVPCAQGDLKFMATAMIDSRP